MTTTLVTAIVALSISKLIDDPAGIVFQSCAFESATWLTVAAAPPPPAAASAAAAAAATSVTKLYVPLLFTLPLKSLNVTLK